MVLEFSNMAFFSYVQSCVDEAFADASKPEDTIPRVFLFVAQEVLTSNWKICGQVGHGMQSICSKTSPTECIPFVSIQLQKTKSSKTRINPQFPTKQRSVWGRSYLWTFFGLLKNHHETRINTRENDYCKKIKSWHESWTRYEVSWKGQSKIGCVLYTHPFYCEFVGLGRRFPSIYAVIRRIFEGFLGRSI